MGKGYGKSWKQRVTNVNGCCVVTCMILLYIVGLPALIAGIVLVRIGEGDFDDEKQTSIEDCLAGKKAFGGWHSQQDYDSVESNEYRTHNSSKCDTWDDWRDEKRELKTIGIVVVVLSVLLLIVAIFLTWLTCFKVCRKRGEIHGLPGAAGVASLPGAVVYTSQGAQPQQYAMTSPGGQVTFIPPGTQPQMMMPPANVPPQEPVKPPTYESHNQTPPVYQASAPPAETAENCRL